MKETERVAKKEGIETKELEKLIAQGRVVILRNKRRKIEPCAIGERMRIKVNTNIGTSTQKVSIKEEIKKLKVAIEAGTDTVMDLSTGGNLKKVRKEIIENSSVPLGTVPIYEAGIEMAKRYGDIARMTSQSILEKIEEQAEEGVDFMTIHSGVSLSTVSKFREKKRLLPIVSRGGSFLAHWMLNNKRENPLLENFSKVLKIAKKYRITISLGDGLRPGSIIDSTDIFQIEELIILGKQAGVALKEGVQVMIEGPGHIPLQEVEMNVLLAKKICGNFPFYVLGPLVTDIAPGYDHIVGAIGGAIAGAAGADFLCFVTPAEHLGLPTVKEVREGVIATRIAAHSADIARGREESINKDRELSLARQKRDWEKQKSFSLDKSVFEKRNLSDVCSMCGKYCALKIGETIQNE